MPICRCRPNLLKLKDLQSAYRKTGLCRCADHNNCAVVFSETPVPPRESLPARRRASARRLPFQRGPCIDAAEWVWPYDDEKLGLNKIAEYYYYPAWWEGSTCNHVMINLAKWNELPKHYQSIIAGAAAYANTDVTARYDARNPAALRKLLASGTELRPFSQPIMEACLKASNDFMIRSRPRG
jgi:hypothetical protein